MTKRPTPKALLEFYYLATPLFLLVDVVLSAPIRVASLDQLGLRWLYYGGLMVLALVMQARPSLGPVIGLVESSVNLLLLVLSILLPIWGMLDQAATGGALSLDLTPWKLLNVALSGPILVLAIKQSEWALQKGR